MPEATRVGDAVRRRTECENSVRDLRVQVDDLTAEQKRADHDVESVRARRQRDQGMIDSGAVATPREIEHMLEELKSLERRIGDLEDAELEVMQRLEDAQHALEQRSGELADLDRERDELTAARDARSAELNGDLEQTATERKQVVADVPADLVALYEKLRAQKRGIGAAALRAKQCGGCRLALDTALLGEIAGRPADDVVRCEECGRILVRTGESGL